MDIKFSSDVLSCLRSGKNLLAFSHGVDSTALFYLLVKFSINFDIAIVDYNLRPQSKLEVAGALALAKEHGKKCFVKSVNLDGVNFEKRARDARYAFFDELSTKDGYENLILAHQLNDLFEWFLMQFSKGAGLSELLGMSAICTRKKYTIIRPLLSFSKAELLEFLHKNGFKYFVDESNFDVKYTRNYFRHEFCEPFLAKFKSGVKRSFELLVCDALNLEPDIRHIKDDLYAVKYDKNVIRGIDRISKILGVLLSSAGRAECERILIGANPNGVIAGKIAFGLRDDFVFICPFISLDMDKKFKEKCRILSVPKLVRPYLFAKNLEPKSIFCL